MTSKVKSRKPPPKQLIFCNRKMKKGGNKKLLLVSFVCKGTCMYDLLVYE